ncbi:MAG: hypothetical protein AVDCRST_MAG59-784, partial [uncultured Thermomicrobiales bacterium]
MASWAARSSSTPTGSALPAPRAGSRDGNAESPGFRRWSARTVAGTFSTAAVAPLLHERGPPRRDKVSSLAYPSHSPWSRRQESNPQPAVYKAAGGGSTAVRGGPRRACGAACLSTASPRGPDSSAGSATRLATEPRPPRVCPRSRPQRRSVQRLRPVDRLVTRRRFRSLGLGGRDPPRRWTTASRRAPEQERADLKRSGLGEPPAGSRWPGDVALARRQGLAGPAVARLTPPGPRGRLRPGPRRRPARAAAPGRPS